MEAVRALQCTEAHRDVDAALGIFLTQITQVTKGDQGELDGWACHLIKTYLKTQTNKQKKPGDFNRYRGMPNDGCFPFVN